jgi:hypothetical protein
MGHFKKRRAVSVGPGTDEPGFPDTSRQAHHWPQQQRDARHQRTDAARQDEKKKVFHAAIPFLEGRRLSLQSVPAIRICEAGLSQSWTCGRQWNLAQLPIRIWAGHRST